MAEKGAWLLLYDQDRPVESPDDRDRRVGTPTRAIAQRLSYLEQQVLRIQARLNQIFGEIQDSRGAHSSRSNGWRRLMPWHADFSIAAYVSLLSVLMLIAFAVQIVWS
jgi:hypothetical protein